MRCDIIIPVWNQLEYTKACVEHIVKNTRFRYRLIVIDNGSGAETKAYLEGLKGDSCIEYELIRNDENLGFVKAVNQGLSRSTGEYVCVMNNDTLPAPGWLERMIDFADTHPMAGLINPQQSGHGDMTLEEYASLLEKRKGAYMEMNQCQGFCMLMKREVLDTVGLLDEAFGIGGYDDTDYSMRAYRAGYLSVAIKDSYVYHRLHGSFDVSGDRESWVRKNRALYYAKWGRHLRVGIRVSQDEATDEEFERVLLFAYGLARELSWVHLWFNIPKGGAPLEERAAQVLEKNGLAPHQNIRVDRFELPAAVFDAALAAKLIERMRARMRDKRFDGLVMRPGEAHAPLVLAARLTGAAIVRFKAGRDAAGCLEEGKAAARAIREKANVRTV